MPKPNAPRTGEIWDVLLSPVVGHEQGGLRPVLVISNDDYNTTPHGLALVVPMTGTVRNVPSHLPIGPPEGGLSKPSVLMCEQVRATSILRFRRRRGMVNADTLAVVQAIAGRFIDGPPTT